MADCTACSACATGARLPRAHLDVAQAARVVALAGNPNTGKSTVFNALTGLRQHTGNWPGKTVARSEGSYTHKGRRYKLVDLPGTYSLLSTSQDEEIARNFILFGRPDCTVVVTDATCLERNLNLVLQVLEISDKVVVCVNLMDEARRKGLQVDVRSLSRDLGVPVVPTVARNNKGLDDLTAAIAGLIDGRTSTKPHHVKTNGRFRQAVDELLPLIDRAIPGLPNARWVAMRLLDGDDHIRGALVDGRLAGLAAHPRLRTAPRSRGRTIEGAASDHPPDA